MISGWAGQEGGRSKKRLGCLDAWMMLMGVSEQEEEDTSVVE